MADFPTTTLEVAFTSPPFSAAPVWYDISSYLEYPARLQRGRQHELNTIEAGTLNLTLNNQDRRFDPAWSAGPYYGYLKPGRRLRLKATWTSTTYTLFDGFIERLEPKEDVRTGRAWAEI